MKRRSLGRGKMRITDRLIQQNRQIAQKRKQQEGEEETMTYQDRSSRKFFNCAEQETYTSRMSEGINTRASVFDRKAAFHTKKKK